MPSCCVVPNCGDDRRKQLEGVVFHIFPLKDAERCQRWLGAIRNPKYGESTPAETLRNLRVCSLHFTADDYERGVQGEPLGPGDRKRRRRRLRGGVVPSVKLRGGGGGGGGGGESGSAGISQPPQKRRRTTLVRDVFPSTSATGLLTSTPTKPAAATTPRHLPLGPVTDSHSATELGGSLCSVEDQHPETESSSLSSSDEEPQRKDWQQRKAVAYEAKVLDLFKMCQICGKPISDTDVSYNGAQMRIKWDCRGGHSGTWLSSPDVGGVPEVDLLTACAVLFTGSTMTALEDWCRVMNLKMMTRKTFYQLQKSHLSPVVEDLYALQREQILARLFLRQAPEGEEPPKLVHLAGDARYDSSGLSGKYCHYTFMVDDTKEIVHTELVQVKEAPSSGAMKELGFKRGLTELRNRALKIEVVATDGSPSVQRTMQRHFPEYNHQFDIKHTSKGFYKKLLQKAKRKDMGELLHWSRSIANHMWWSSATCEGVSEELKRRWLSILHHVLDEHSWTEDGEPRQCYHALLSKEERRRKKWLARDSPAYQELRDLVTDQRLMEDMEHMGLFKHSGPLEVFHRAMLKYLPKRQHFCYAGMRARGMLAILEHNENIVKRRRAKTSTGKLQHTQYFCQHTRQWMPKAVYEPHTHLFRRELVNRVVGGGVMRGSGGKI